MNISNLLISLIPNLSLHNAQQISLIINAIYGICIAIMVISLIYYTGLMFWRIYHASNDEEIKYYKKIYLKRIIAFICFLFLFVIIGIIIDVIAPIIKNDTLKGNN